jgi:tRNA dimethylallyltransferase
MNPAPPRVVAIVGPTASAKTALAIEVARAGGAEIVNADSRQVFRRLDVGSAKPTPAERAAAPHHLIDVVDPDEPFSAAEFQRRALEAIDDIAARGRRVVVVGGTGLYVKALRGGLFTGPPRDPEQRARLEAEEDAEPGVLHRRLCEVDPEAAARIHANDRIRLVRGLEVFTLTGRPISALQREHAFGQRTVEMRTLAPAWDRGELYARIDARCVAMLDAGLFEEVRGLLAAGYDPQLSSLRSPGYRETIAHLRGDCALAQALADMQKATRNLAKRQLTWFRNDTATEWLPPDPEAFVTAAEQWWTD